MITDRVLQIIKDLQPGDHLCSLYQTEAEHCALLTPFLRRGLEQGEKALYIVDAQPAETRLNHLQNNGLEVEAYLASGQLCLLTPGDTYLRGGAFDPDGMIALLRTETERALAEGYQALRTAGDMTWALRGLPGPNRLLEYESKLSSFFPGSRCLAVCLYAWQRLDLEMLFNILATHPIAALGTEIYANFYSLPSVELEKDGLPTAILRHWLETLAGRKRAEEALQASEARYRAIVEDQTEFICRFLPDGRRTFVNEAYCRYFGRKSEELIGNSITQFILAEDQAEPKELLASLSQENPVATREEWNVPPSGEMRRLQWTNRAIFDEQGQLIEFQSVGRDITERKRAEEERARYATQLQGLAEVALIINSSLSTADILKIVTEKAREILKAHQAVTSLTVNENWSQAIQHVSLSHKYAAWREYAEVPDGSGIYALVCQTGRSMRLTQAELEAHPAWRGFGQARGKHPPMRGWLAAPLIAHNGQNIGLIQLSDKYEGEFNENDEAILVQLAQMVSVAVENVQLFEQVHGGRERLHALSRRLLEVQEAERRHIARELHDEIGQVLTGLKLLLDMSARLPAKTVKSRLGEAQALVNELMERVDELSLNLRPEMLDDLGLLPTLLWHFERYTHQTNIQVMFKQTGLEGQRFTPEIETTVYRLIQEALTNVARHAKVSEVKVWLWVGQDTLGLEIEDRGVGFDAHLNGSSTGLSGMRERTVLLGGQLTIESSPGGGTYITAELPRLSPPRGANTYDNHHSGR